MNTLIVLIGLNLLLAFGLMGTFLYFRRRLAGQRAGGVPPIPQNSPRVPTRHKCHIVAFIYRHRITAEVQSLTFHSLCDAQPVLDEAFGKSHAPAGFDLIECRGGSHVVKASA